MREPNGELVAWLGLAHRTLAGLDGLRRTRPAESAKWRQAEVEVLSRVALRTAQAAQAVQDVLAVKAPPRWLS